jgi:hypothetical protein
MTSSEISMTWIMTAKSRSLLLTPLSVASASTIFPSAFTPADPQRLFETSRIALRNVAIHAGYGKSCSMSTKINSSTLALLSHRSVGGQRGRFMIRLVIACFVCPAGLGTGLVSGALIAQNQPISELERHGLSPEIPRFFAVEANAAQPTGDHFTPAAQKTLPKLAM